MRTSATNTLVAVSVVVLTLGVSLPAVGGKFKIPFADAEHYHMDTIHSDSFGLYRADTDDLTCVDKGQLRQCAYVGSAALGGAGLEVMDTVWQTLRVQESGDYLVTFKGSLEGNYWNIAYYKWAFAKGALKLGLTGEVHTLHNDVEVTKVLYDRDLTPAAFIQDVVWAELKNLLFYYSGGSSPDPDLMQAASVVGNVKLVLKQANTGG